MVPASRTAITRLFLVVVLVLVSVASLPWTPTARAAVFMPATVADLIAAINTANADLNADEIVLTAGATYTLTAVDNVGTDGSNGLPVISSEITITGNGASITRDAVAPAFRILEVSSSGSLTLNNLTISNGSADNGGGIYTEGGTLTLTDSTLSDNTAAGFGGGIYINEGTLALTNNTLSGNTAGVLGGGIHTEGGTLTLTNNTISGNTARMTGGGIANSDGAQTLINNTVSGNTASDYGGGIATLNGTLTLTNTIVAGNAAAQSNPDIDVIVTTVTGSHNLIGDGSDLTDLTDGVDGNQVGTTAAPIDPLLEPLAANGGATQTMAPQLSSPAINAGNDTLAPATDQRGIARPQGAASDIGAVEVSVPTHTELCALTQDRVSRAAVARSACAMLAIARRADLRGMQYLEQLALANFRMTIRSAISRRYIPAEIGQQIITTSQLL